MGAGPGQDQEDQPEEQNGDARDAQLRRDEILRLQRLELGDGAFGEFPERDVGGFFGVGK